MTAHAHRNGVNAELSSLDRGLCVLAFIQDRGQVEVSEVIAGLDIPSSTAYRYVRLLKSAGFVVDVGGRLMPSGRLVDRSVGRSEHLVDLARPVLSRLRARTGLNVVLTVRVHTAALCLDTRYGGSGRMAFRPGEILTLYAGASATPLLAMAPDAVQRQVLEGRLTRFTAVTPDAETLRDELAAVRGNGYHMTRGWLTPGMTAVGVPVLESRVCLCALSLVGPDRAIPDSTEHLAVLREASDELVACLPRAPRTAWTPPDESGTAEDRR